MQTNSKIKMPNGFAQRVHHALRSWYSQKPDDSLDDLLLSREIAAERPGATSRLISNQVLLSGLALLQQSDEEAVKLLQSRFHDQDTAQAVGFRHNISEDIVFQHQRAAIEQLAELIWGQEQALLQQRRRQMEARLEAPSYTRLFGVAKKLDELRSFVESDADAGVLALEGIGGLGKTSLADALARDLAASTRFEEIGWVSARQRLFQLSGEVSLLNTRPDLTITELIDTLIEQFGLKGLAHASDTEKSLGMKDFLKSRPCFVVVDNLETAANYSILADHLTALAGPSKFLVTTRYSLRDVSGVYIMPLQQLAFEDALELIRHEAKTRGSSELSRASEDDLKPIYTLTGGNPLAIKMVIGQIHSLSLPVVLSRLSAGKGMPVEALLDFLYADAWETLDAVHRRVLQAMLLVADVGRLAQIAAASELSEEDAAACLHRLAGLSLVNVSGGLHERRYSLHQLTQAFVSQRA